MSGPERPPAPAPLRTSCGRTIVVKHLDIRIPGLTIARVALDIGPESSGSSQVWAGLSPREARELARRLIEEAESAERRTTGRGEAVQERSA